MGSTTRFFLSLFKEKASFLLDSNFFLTQALTGHDYLHEYSSVSNSVIFLYPCGEDFQDCLYILYDCPRFNDFQRAFRISSKTIVLSPSFTKLFWDGDLAFVEGTILKQSLLLARSRRH